MIDRKLIYDIEAFEERAAICEFDGKLSRAEAEKIAYEEDQAARKRAGVPEPTTKPVRSVQRPKSAW